MLMVTVMVDVTVAMVMVVMVVVLAASAVAAHYKPTHSPVVHLSFVKGIRSPVHLEWLTKNTRIHHSSSGGKRARWMAPKNSSPWQPMTSLPAQALPPARAYALPRAHTPPGTPTSMVPMTTTVMAAGGASAPPLAARVVTDESPSSRPACALSAWTAFSVGNSPSRV